MKLYRHLFMSRFPKWTAPVRKPGQVALSYKTQQIVAALRVASNQIKDGKR